jgi:transposase-like protein
MYDQSFRNQAVKECVNGQSLRGTARKYGISDTSLRSWVNEYKKRMAEMSGSEHEVIVESREEEAVIKEPVVMLRSVNVNIDGHDITMSKRDVIKLMEIFYQFDK